MAHVFGISNHSPDKVLTFLLKRDAIAEMSKVAIVPFGTQLKPDAKPVRSILFVISVSDLYRNLTVINSKAYRNTQIFVFASPLRINELENAIPLDYEDNQANKGVGFVLKKDINFAAYSRALKAERGEVKRLDTKYLTLLTDTTKHGSLLNPLMTFIYTLPGASYQTPVKEAIAVYLYKGISFDKLQSIFDGLRDVNISQKHRDRIRDILVSEVGDRYRAAFKEYRAAKAADKTVPLTSICKRNGTSEYEMKYLKSIIDSKTRNKGTVGKPLNSLQGVA